jgi:uncharacterized protein YbjQ (UPF0145 family)
VSFTSNLTVAEHHAVRSVGFTPVGQVLGSCVYAIGYTGTWNCGYWGYGGLGGLGGFGRGGPGWTASPGWQPGGLPGRGIGGGIGGGFGGGGYAGVTVVEATGLRDSLYEARTRAMERMRQEAERVGGDGVVAVRLSVGPFDNAGTLEFRAIGTAVRADGPIRPRSPFLSDLTGQEFALLLSAGWVPAALVLGIAVMVRHDDWATRRQTSAWTNQEVGGYTELVGATRDAARARLRDDCARHGGTTVVVREMSLRIGEQACNSGQQEGRDHIAEAMVVGTAIVPFEHAGGNAPAPPLPVLHLQSGRNP